jgi:GT2 family glycosyltransferase
VAYPPAVQPRPSGAPAAAREPSGVALSVVLITRDRAEEASQALARLVALPERPEIIVVDNGSRDGTPERVAREFPSVKVIAERENRGAAGRTIGARAASGRLIAFCDDDSWWTPGALERAAAIFDAHPSVALIAARVLVGDAGEPDPACEEMAASPLPTPSDLPGRRVLGFIACGAVVRRDAFLAVGGFEPRNGVGGEERLLAVALAEQGWNLLYVEDLVVHHHPSPVRDRARRRAVALRNDLWFHWLRRPLRPALAETARALAAASREPAARSGALEALRGARWVLSRRRRLPPAVEAELRLLD